MALHWTLMFFLSLSRQLHIPLPPLICLLPSCTVAVISHPIEVIKLLRLKVLVFCMFGPLKNSIIPLCPGVVKNIEDRT